MVTEHMRGVTRHLGQVALREKEHAQMKKLIAVAGLGAALTIGSIGGVARSGPTPPPVRSERS